LTSNYALWFEVWSHCNVSREISKAFAGNFKLTQATNVNQISINHVIK